MGQFDIAKMRRNMKKGLLFGGGMGVFRLMPSLVRSIKIYPIIRHGVMFDPSFHLALI
jgi:hypothetical protein